MHPLVRVTRTSASNSHATDTTANWRKAEMLRVQTTAWTRCRAESFRGVSVNGVSLLHNSFLYTFLCIKIVRPALTFLPLHANLERRGPCVHASLLARCVFRVVDFKCTLVPARFKMFCLYLFVISVQMTLLPSFVSCSMVFAIVQHVIL